jgi:RHS repeat-associated protein
MSARFQVAIYLLVIAFLIPAGPAEAKYLGGVRPVKICESCGAVSCPAPSSSAPTNTASGTSTSLSEGNLIETYAGPSIRGRNCGSVSLNLTFNSNLADGSNGRVNTVLGVGWTHSYNLFLFSQRSEMFRFEGNGRVNKFTPTSSTEYRSTEGYFTTLKRTMTGFTLVFKDGSTEEYALVPGSPTFDGQPVYWLQKMTDRIGNTTGLTYTGGVLTSVTNVYGLSLTFTYTAGKLSSISDPLGRDTTLEYDSTNTRLLRIVDPTGKAVEYTYNALYEITQKLDKNGQKFTFGYLVDKPVSVTDGAGAKLFSQTNTNNWATNNADLALQLMRTYIPSTTSRKDGNGRVWQYDYDTGGYITRVRAPDGAVTTYTYDPATLNVASITDANGQATSYEYDGIGNLTKQTDALGHATTHAYTNPACSDKVTRTTFPNGSITEYEYDAACNRTRQVRDVSGLTLLSEWTYDIHGNVLTERDPNGHLTSHEYDAYGNHAKTIDPEGNVTQYEYDLVGNRIKMIDGNTHATTYEYDPLNRLVKVTDPLGYITEYAYDGNNNRTQVRKQVAPAAYQITLYQYDLRNRLIRETRILPAAPLLTAYTYDGNDNRTSMTDPRGKLTRYQYDLQNRMTLVRDALSNTTQTLYDGVGNRTRTIDANNHYIYFQYDALNRLITEIRKIGDTSSTPDGNDIVTRMFYDAGNTIPAGDCGGNVQCAGPTPGSGGVAYSIDPESKYTYFKYDKAGRRVMTLRKVGDTADARDGNDWTDIIRYDAVGNILNRIDPNGYASTFTYLRNNWKASEANGLGETTYFTYDGVGNVLTVTAPNLNVTTNSYSPRNELTNIRDSVGQVASYSYDGVGNRLTETDGNSNTTTYQYDLVSRLTGVTDAMSQTRRHFYDPANNLIRTTDREGKATCYGYDDINRRTLTTQKVGDTNCAVVDADDIWTTTEYDKVGNVARLITAKHNGTNTPTNCASGTPGPECEITRYTYDEVNRLKTETYPDAKQRAFTYDKASNLKTRLDQNGITTAYVYNDLYYLTQRAYPASFDSFSYDIGGRMLSATRGGWVNGFTYDAANRVLQATQGGKTVSYAYNIPGRTRTVTYPGGKSITENTDPRSRLDNIQDGGGAPLVQYVYDLGNRVDTRTYRNNVVAKYAYNPNNWITDLSHKHGTALIAGFGHDHDREGNKLKQQNQLDGPTVDCSHDTRHKCSEKYAYDDVYRLIDYKVGDLVNSTIAMPITQAQYELDKVGNWDKWIVNGVPQTRTHNTVNEITSINGAPLSYDNNGNLKQDPRYQYLYDEENRLTRVTRLFDSRVMGQYRYDALSRRIAKIANLTGVPVETRYFYDDARIVEEQDTGGVPLATYVYGNYIDEVLTMDRGGQTYYYHQNALWSVAAVTDGAANVAERYSYDAYAFATITDASGTLVPVWDVDRPRSAIGNPWMFTGRQLDEESGLYFYRARYYDALKGRFLQRDPLGYVDGPNLYFYVQNSPTNLLDPMGLDKCCVKSFKVEFVGRGWIFNFDAQQMYFQFNMEATFKNDREEAGCCCECCQYRQYVWGHYNDRNGPVAFFAAWLPKSPPATEDRDRLDLQRYGHKTGTVERSDQDINRYPTVCSYQGSDEPGRHAGPLAGLDFMFHFEGKIVSARNPKCEDDGVTRARKDWAVGALIKSKTSYIIGYTHPM